MRSPMMLMSLMLMLSGLLVAGVPAQELRAPQVQTYQGTPYLSGGVGEEELAALRQMAHAYNVQLLFATKTGEYLADVHVTFVDAHGRTVLDAVADGPWLYTTLPAGKYTIRVQSTGQTQQRVVQVSQQKQTHLHFAW